MWGSLRAGQDAPESEHSQPIKQQPPLLHHVSSYDSTRHDENEVLQTLCGREQQKLEMQMQSARVPTCSAVPAGNAVQGGLEQRHASPHTGVHATCRQCEAMKER